jgi:hypothetical protein
VREVLVLDGRVSDEVRPDAQAEAAQRRLAAMPVDSIVDLRFVDDSAGLAALGLCPADGGAMVVTTAAYARAHGLRPPPPALCVRAVDGRHPPRMAVPVGQAVRVAAGQLDILDECDRPAPPDVRWTSSKLAVLMVDGVGVARARAGPRGPDRECRGRRGAPNRDRGPTGRPGRCDPGRHGPGGRRHGHHRGDEHRAAAGPRGWCRPGARAA